MNPEYGDDLDENKPYDPDDEDEDENDWILNGK